MWVLYSVAYIVAHASLAMLAWMFGRGLNGRDSNCISGQGKQIPWGDVWVNSSMVRGEGLKCLSRMLLSLVGKTIKLDQR